MPLKYIMGNWNTLTQPWLIYFKDASFEMTDINTIGMYPLDNE